MPAVFSNVSTITTRTAYCHEDAASVPSAIKLAIMHTVAFLYEFRDAPMGAFATTSGQVPGQAQILLNPYKVLTL